MSIQPLWLTYFIEILLVLEFQLTKTYFDTFSYKAHFRPQISSNVNVFIVKYLVIMKVIITKNQKQQVKFSEENRYVTTLFLASDSIKNVTT